MELGQVFKAWRVVGGIGYMCPACKRAHVVSIGHGGWSFNGNLESPSLQPSVKIPSEGCHAVITDGIAHFTDDCTNGFAGKVIPLDDAENR